jgi:Flp pilus assembly protein TadD
MATPAQQLAKPPEACERPFHSPAKRRAILSLALVLLSLLVHNPATHNGFVGFDDPAYVTANSHVRSGLTWTTVKWAFRSTEHANWHPLTWLSHALDYQLFQLNPAGHHFVNVLLHTLTAVVLFLALGALTGSMGSSWVVAALFALHPINIQSVAWISERKNTLCTFFFVFTLLAYRWYVQHPNFQRYLGVALLFMLGVMAKPMIITLPFVLLLLDYWPLDRVRASARSQLRLVIEKLPLLTLSAASAAVTLAVQRAGGAIRSDYPFWLRFSNAVISYVRYLGKAVWPSRLAVFYPYPTQAPPASETLGALFLLILVTAGVLFARKRPYLAVGWFWYLGTLVPVIGLVQAGEQGMADRYAYIPFIGLFIAVVWTIRSGCRARRISLLCSGLAAAAVLSAYGIADRAEISYWKNNLSLWSRALAVTQNNYVAENSLGAELTNEGRFEEAIEHFQAAAAINPRDAFSQLDLGVCEKRLGNFPAAVKHYQSALDLSTEPTLRATAFSNLGSIYRVQKNYARAEESYKSALELQPDNLFALVGMGLVAQKLGELNRAIEYFSRAVAAQPSDSEYLLLAQALDTRGRKQEAAAAYQRAQQISPNWAASVTTVRSLLDE